MSQNQKNYIVVIHPRRFHQTINDHPHKPLYFKEASYRTLGLLHSLGTLSLGDTAEQR